MRGNVGGFWKDVKQYISIYGTNSAERQLLTRCSEIFIEESGPYETAKQLSVKNRKETGELDTATLLNFRKSLSNIGEFFERLSENDRLGAEEELKNIETHLRKTACYSAESLAEYYLKQIEKRRLKYFIFYKILNLESPTKHDYQDQIDSIEDLIENAEDEEIGNWNQKVEYYIEAYRYSRSLYRDFPTQRAIRNRSVMLIVGIGGLIGTILTIISLFFL